MLLLKALILLASLYELHAYYLGCYVTNWAQYRPSPWLFKPGQTPANLCTHLYYSFAKLTNGQLAMYEWNDDVLYAETVALKQQNPSLKVILAVGGWNMGSTDFSNMVSTDNGIDTFVATSITFLQRYGFDGLDLDWEYPSVGVGSRPQDKDRFTILCQKLSAAYKPRGLLLTAAVAAGQGTIDTAYNIPGIAPYLDILNIMTYDYHGGWDNKVGANSPLYPHPTQSSQAFACDFTVNYYISKGFPANKIALGMGSYGRSFRLANANNYGMGSAATGPGTAGTYTREAGFLAYYEICQRLTQGWSYNYDPVTESVFSHSVLEWVSFDNEYSLDLKVDYLKSKGLMGGFFWAVDLDDFSGSACGKGPYPLINYVKAKLGGGTVPTQGPTTTPGPTQPTQPTQTNPGGTTTPSSIQCSSDGIFPNPQDCSSYIHCNHGIPHITPCPNGLHFNPSCTCCDWPGNVNCSIGKK